MAPAELLLTAVLLWSGHAEGAPRRPPRLKYSSGAHEDAGCQETEEVVKSQLLEALAPTDVVPDAISENSYIQFDFLVPVVVLGWSTRGRTGPMTGDTQQRSGFVDSYGATYITTTGNMIRLHDPVTHTEEFVSKGNLATPDVGTAVKLPTPIETTSLRLTPLTWSGVPFMEVALTLCTSALQEQLELAREARGVSDAEKELKTKIMADKARNVEEDLELIRSDLAEQGEMEDAMIGNSDEFKAKVMEEDADRLSDDLKALEEDLGGHPARVAKEAMIQEEIPTQEKTGTPKTEEPQDAGSTSPIEKETKRLQEELKNLNSDLADQALRNLENAHKLVTKQPSEAQLLCQQPATWRYEMYTAPSDTFTASGNSDQAWRAIFGIGFVPYLFPTDTAAQHQHRMLEVHFRNRSRVTGLKVKGAYNVASGSSEAPDWGAVSRFSLLYRGHGGKWDYYADSSGTARVFQTGIASMTDAAQPVTFHLPTPVDTDAIAIIPHDWLHKPYLSLDILACYLVSSTVGSNSLATSAWEADTLPLQKKISTPAKTAMSAHEQFQHVDEDATNKLLAMVPPKKSKTSSGSASSTEDCNQSLIAQNGRLKRLLFTNMHEAMLYDNEDHYATIAMSEPRKVTALMVASPNKINSHDEAVKIFIIKYKSSQLSPHWTLLTKHSGEIKMFSTKSDEGNPTTINLPTPVVAEELRIIPQKWTGSNPEVYIDILGCVP